jgi:hypothetical protein
MGTQTGFDIAQTLPVGELREAHAQIRVEAGEGFDLVVPTITLHAALEHQQRKMLGNLRENPFACVHVPASSVLAGYRHAVLS